MPPTSETRGLSSSSAQQARVRPVLPAITHGSGMQPQIGSGLHGPNLPDHLENAPFLTEAFLVNFEGGIPQGQIFESFDRTQNNRVFWRARISFGSMPGIITTVLPPWKNPRDWKEVHRCSGGTPRHKVQAYTKSMENRRQRLARLATSQNSGDNGYARAASSLRSAPVATNQYNNVHQQPVLGSGSQGSQNPSVSSVQHAGKEDIQATWNRAMFITDDFVNCIILPLKVGYVFETWNRDAKCRYLWRVKLEIRPSTNLNKPLPGRDLAYWELLDIKSGSPAVEKLQRYDAAVARAQMPVPYMSPPSNGSGGSGRESQFGTAPPPAKTVPRAMNDPNPPSHGAVSFPVASIARAHALAGINPSDLENAWRTAKYIDKRFLLSFRGYLKQGSYFESQTRSPKGRQRVLWAVAKDMDTKSLPGGVISPPWSAKSPYWKELDRRRGTSDAEKVANARAVAIRMEERHGISSTIRFPSQMSGRSASPVKSAPQLTATQRTVLASTRKRGATGSVAVTRALAASTSLPDIREYVTRV